MIINSFSEIFANYLIKLKVRKYMTFFIFSLFCFSNTHLKAVGNEIDVLETTNTFPGHWSCSNDGYLYGTDAKNLKIVMRKRENGQSIEYRGDVTSADPSFTIDYKIFSTSTPGLIFVLVKDTTEKFFLLRSADGGSTFRNVFAFGEGNGLSGSNTADVRILRGLLELTTDVPGGGGKGTLFIGEYNVARNRIAGSVNDRVRIMKSTDSGETWTKVVEWNTNGYNQVGHIHAMKQDPYTGEIYICIGDSNSKSGIIKWDGSSEWSDNKTLREINYMKGFKALTGAQRFRVCDVLFGEDYFYTFADTQTFNNQSGSESGIWRGKKNFSEYTRMDNQIFDYDPMHIGWFGEKIGNTYIFTTSREIDPNFPWSQMNTLVYCSSDGINWHASGILNWRDSESTNRTLYIRNVFSFNNKLYIDCIPGAGHLSTIQCSLTRKWEEGEDPVILHPVYFVGTWNTTGNDANSGCSPDAPKRTLNNLLSSNRICAGARVRISSGTFYEPDIYPLWSAAALQGKGKTVIEGQGMDRTHIIRSSGTGSATGIKIDSTRTLTNANTPLVFRSLNFFVTTDGGNNHTNYVIYNTDSYVRTEQCRIGDNTNDDSPLIFLADSGAKYVSVSSFHVARSGSGPQGIIISTNSPGTSYDLTNCVILNAYNAFENTIADVDLSLRNCTFHGIRNSAVIFSGEWNTKPVIKNCIFSCGTSPLQNHVALISIDIDYNFYNSDNQNITDGGHSIMENDPLFVSASSGNFNLQSSSPCIMGGIYMPDVKKDMINRLRSAPPCIGAFENTGIFVSPSGITVGPSSQEDGVFSVRSNTIWQVTGYDSWLDLSVMEGKGSETVTISTNSPNISTSPRISQVTFSAAGVNPITVAVTQEGDIETAIEERDKENLKIYPNPSNGKITIECYNGDYKSINILDSKGKLISKVRITEPVLHIELYPYGKGLYLLEFINIRGETRREKIINI